MRMTQSDVLAHEARLKRSKSRPNGAGEDFTGREADLHAEIIKELVRRRWFYVHSRTDKRTTQQKGVPDFIIASSNTVVKRDENGLALETSRTYWVEVKRKGGKLTPEQTVTKHVLQALGHKWAVVYSFQEFLDFIDS